MRLKKVQIKNFRSIADAEILTIPSCQVLVGLNECGKSNILRALRLLSPDQAFSADDKRDPLPDEGLVEESYVRFVFEFSDDEILQFHNRAQEQLLCAEGRLPFVRLKGRDLTIKEFCSILNEGLYVVDLIKNKRMPSRWALPQSLSVHPGWKSVSKRCPKDYTVQPPSQEGVLLAKFRAVYGEEHTEIPPDYLEELTAQDLAAIYWPAMDETITKALPTCVSWEYSEKNLLPGKIDLNAFVSDPNTCIPLKMMFNLADVEDISAEVANAKARPNGLRNLLNRVADRATKHIQGIWKEYREISIFLAENGPHVEAGVQDKSNIYNFARRSDGFKRFITFLLLISARERTKQLSGALILIDEPDICLHPSGAKYLRDELLKIAASNTVFYSTHSIFMIDRETPSRHLIISKKNEITSVARADTSNILDEEVIYNALGYSVFEGLQLKNIVFEGWRDKNLFRVALRARDKGRRAVAKLFDGIGTCHAEGVKDIPRIASLLDLANRRFVIISDDDQVAIQRQTSYRGEGTWLRYSEVQGNGHKTSEDFIAIPTLRVALGRAISSIENCRELALPAFTSSSPRLETIKIWLRSNGVPKEDQDKILSEFKECVFSTLEPKAIEDSYFQFLEGLHRLLESK